MDSDSNHIRDVIRLKSCDPQRFSTLCKMHLTFVLNLENEEFSNFLETKNSGQSNKKSVFGPIARRIRGKSVNGVANGAPLTQEGICQVYQLIEYLGRDFNITQEGLFRKSGKLSRQQELKDMLNFGAAVDLDLGQYSVHECASVLKSFLADLPQPLLTEAHYQAHCKVPDLYSEDMTNELKSCARTKQLKTLQLLFLLLPSNNRRLLQDVLVLLHRVTKAQKDNLMNSTNLAMMFAPHIMCPRKLSGEELQEASANITKAVSFMIDFAPDLFKVPRELYLDVVAYWKEHHRETSKQANYKALKAKFGLDSPESNGVMVNTKLAFCDRKPTSESSEDSTTIAVAGLYAYVHSMPDCPQKRKFIKQFNKENGYGVDLDHPPVRTKHKRSKTVGDSMVMTSVDGKGYNSASRTSFDSHLTPKKRKANDENNPPEVKHSPIIPPKSLKVDSSTPSFAKYSSPFATSVLRASRRVKIYNCTPTSISSVKSKRFHGNSIQSSQLEHIKNQSLTPTPVGKYSSPLARSVLRASRRVKNAVMPNKTRTAVVLQSTKTNVDS